MASIGRQMGEATESLYLTTFETPGLCSADKIARIERLEKHLGELVVNNPSESLYVLPNIVRVKAILATVPSLKQVALGEIHTADVAHQVTNRLTGVARELYQDGWLKHTDQRHVGIFNKLGVLASLWWSIENGYMHPDSYALLSRNNYTQTANTGNQANFDISFRHGGNSPKKHAIQVMPRMPVYIDKPTREVVKLTPNDLMTMRRIGQPAATLLSSLATNENVVLEQAAYKARSLFALDNSQASHRQLAKI